MGYLAKYKIAAVLVFFLFISSQPKKFTKPNVIIILTDDQGWGDLSMNGNINISTPNIDGIAAAGQACFRPGEPAQPRQDLPHEVLEIEPHKGREPETSDVFDIVNSADFVR